MQTRKIDETCWSWKRGNCCKRIETRKTFLHTLSNQNKHSNSSLPHTLHQHSHAQVLLLHLPLSTAFFESWVLFYTTAALLLRFPHLSQSLLTFSAFALCAAFFVRNLFFSRQSVRSFSLSLSSLRSQHLLFCLQWNARTHTLVNGSLTRTQNNLQFYLIARAPVTRYS